MLSGLLQLRIFRSWERVVIHLYCEQIMGKSSPHNVHMSYILYINTQYSTIYSFFLYRLVYLGTKMETYRLHHHNILLKLQRMVNLRRFSSENTNFHTSNSQIPGPLLICSRTGILALVDKKSRKDEATQFDFNIS